MQFVAHGNFIQCGRNAALYRIFNWYYGGLDLPGAHMVERSDHRAGREVRCSASFGNSLEGGFGKCAFWTKIRKRLHGCLLYLVVLRAHGNSCDFTLLLAHDGVATGFRDQWFLRFYPGATATGYVEC